MTAKPPRRAVAGRVPSLLLLPVLLLALPIPTPASVDDARQDWEQGKSQSAIVRLKNRLQLQPDDAAARLLLGQIYLELRQPTAAEQELMRAREAGASDAATRAGLAEALLLQGQPSRALEWAEPPADASGPERAEILALRGSTLLSLGQETEAAQAFSAATHAEPESLQGILGKATLEWRRQDFEAARASVRHAVDTHPDAAEAWQALALLERLEGNNQAAVDALGRAIEHARVKWPFRLHRAEAHLDLGDEQAAAADLKGLGDGPQRLPTIHYLEGRLALLRGEDARATERLEAYLRAAPNDLRGIYFAALALNRTGRHAQAEQYLLRLRSELPDNAAALTLLARARLAQGNAAGAEEAIRPAAEAIDATPAALELLRRALARQRRTDEAEAVVQRAAVQFPDLASVQLDYAEQMQRNGDASGSLDLLRRIIATEPDNLRARVLSMRAHLLAGDLDAATASADDLLAQAPESPMAHTAKGALLARQQDLDGARSAFARALELDPSFQRAALALAALELGEDRPEQARQTLDKLLVADPDNTPVTLALAAMELRENDSEAAETRLRAALRRDPTALQVRLALARSYLAAGRAADVPNLLKRVPPEQQQQPPVMLLRAQAELAAGESEAATQTLTELAKRNPTIARYRYMLASALAELGELRAAAANLEDGLKIDRSEELAHARLTRILAAQPTAEARRNMLDRLLSVAPEHPTLRAAKARFLLEQRKNPEAIGMLRELADAYPDAPVYTLWLAAALSMAGQDAQAQQLLRIWLAAHPNNVDARLELAQLAIAAGDLDTAIEQYRRVLERDDNNAVALNNLAMLLAGTSPDEALGYADRALELKPEDTAYIDTKGTVLMAKGDYAAAVELLAKAHAGSTDPSIAFRYAKALAHNGDEGAARRVLFKLQAQSFPEKDEAEALLTRLAGGD